MNRHNLKYRRHASLRCLLLNTGLAADSPAAAVAMPRCIARCCLVFLSAAFRHPTGRPILAKLMLCELAG